jgi:hypothetical protein
MTDMTATLPLPKAAVMKTPKVGQEWYTCEVDERENEATGDFTYTGRVTFHTWVVVTVGTKYITLNRKCPDTWITRKGVPQWDSRISRHDQKRLAKQTFPRESTWSRNPVVFSTQRLAVKGQIAQCLDQLAYWIKQSNGQDFVASLTQEIPILRRKLTRMAENKNRDAAKPDGNPSK